MFRLIVPAADGVSASELSTVPAVTYASIELSLFHAGVKLCNAVDGTTCSEPLEMCCITTRLRFPYAERT